MYTIIECVWLAQAILGECPCWDYRTGRVLWLDIKSTKIYAYSLVDKSCQIWNSPTRICSLDVPCSGWSPPKPFLPLTSFISCGDAGLAWLNLDGEAVQIFSLSHPENDSLSNRFNDGKIGPDGRYWAGTMDDSEEFETGRLYAFQPDGSFNILDDGYRVTNGPAFAPESGTVYHTDSARREIYAFDLEPDGSLIQKRLFFRFVDNDGCPDGMTTDHEGNLWVAIWDGARIEKISPQGKRLDAIRIPTPRPTSCIFTKPDCSEMFVTTASIGLKGDDLFAGGLFRITFV